MDKPLPSPRRRRRQPARRPHQRRPAPSRPRLPYMARRRAALCERVRPTLYFLSFHQTGASSQAEVNAIR